MPKLANIDVVKNGNRSFLLSFELINQEYGSDNLLITNTINLVHKPCRSVFTKYKLTLVTMHCFVCLLLYQLRIMYSNNATLRVLATVNYQDHYSNITTTAERIALLTYTTLVIAMGLIGNIVVITGSVVYHARKNDKIAMTLVQNLACADLMCVVVQVLPTWIVHVTEQWVLGTEMCIFIGVFR